MNPHDFSIQEVDLEQKFDNLPLNTIWPRIVTLMTYATLVRITKGITDFTVYP